MRKSSVKPNALPLLVQGLLLLWGYESSVLVSGFVITSPCRSAQETTIRRYSSLLDQEQSSSSSASSTVTDPIRWKPQRTVRGSEPMPWTLNTETYGPFAQEYTWGWCYTSVSEQASSSYDCTDDAGAVTEGELPRDLCGTYMKIGPGNFEREGRRYEHPLDGDGFVAAFHFDKGKVVRYTGRFVETEFFRNEKEKDRILYRNVFGTQRTGGPLANAFDFKLKNVANTNILAWGGRLLALWEGGRPYELNPLTLETKPDFANREVGPFQNLGLPDSVRGITIDEGGPIDRVVNVGRSFTAHPVRLNDDTLVVFTAAQNVQTNDLSMEFIEYDANWQISSSVLYALRDTAAAPHDFAVSDNYYCMFQNQFDLDNLPFLLGMKAPTQAMQVVLDRPNVLHLVPRRKVGAGAAAAHIQVDVPSYFTIHTVPIVVEETDETITIYSNGWSLKDERFFPRGTQSVPFLGAWGGRYPDFENNAVPPALFYRTVVDLKSGLLLSHQEVLPGLVMEFPAQHGQDPANVYMAVASTDYTSLPGTGLAKVNMATNNLDIWWADHKVFTGEAFPVPKRNDEEGYWVLTILYDSGKRKAALGILDSERFQEGPVCRITLPHSLAYALHSTFVAQ